LVGITFHYQEEVAGPIPAPGTMICVYLVNEEPAYIGMLSLSLKMLRQHNHNVSVIVYYIQDGKRDSRNIPLTEITRALNKLPNDYASFSKLCEELNVEIRVRKPKQEEAYYSLHRLLLQEIEEETVLLLDGDTFIFGNIEEFPTIYAGYDFVATPNSWGMVNLVPGLDPSFKSFNSGVVLCQNGIFKRWMNTIGDYCQRLYDGRHPQSEWLWSVSLECAGREELAASLFVLDNGLKYRYFEDQHVQMGSYDGNARILHTLSPSWHSLYNECFKPQRRMLFKPRLKNDADASREADDDLDYPPKADGNTANAQAE